MNVIVTYHLRVVRKMVGLTVHYNRYNIIIRESRDRDGYLRSSCFRDKWLERPTNLDSREKLMHESHRRTKFMSLPISLCKMLSSRACRIYLKAPQNTNADSRNSRIVTRSCRSIFHPSSLTRTGDIVIKELLTKVVSDIFVSF